MKNFKKYVVSDAANIRSAIRHMDKIGSGFIIIVDKHQKVYGVISDGDFRRAILNGVDLEQNISTITNSNYKYINNGYSDKELIAYFKEDNAINYLPVIDNSELADIIDLDSLELEEVSSTVTKANLNNPVIIMAGGKGTRLDPFTKILPKALIPLGDKPIIQIIIEKFSKYGIKDYFISVNHKNKMIKAFFEDSSLEVNISYIDEDKPLGTVGAIKSLANQIKKPFFVSNCDIIINCNYSDILKFHQENKYMLTLIASMQHHTVPYGVCEIDNDGSLYNIKEKPEYDFLVNTGMYIMNPEILSYIPDNSYFDITDLIETIKEKKHTIGLYPVSEKSWIDVGQWEEYNNASNLFL